MMTHAEHNGQLSRLRRIHGQLAGIIKMIEDQRYCVDILTQTRAVRAAIKKVEQGILETHIDHCLGEAAVSDEASERQRRLKEITEVMRSFV
jgi:DNA-binding FrmR family transcriptional regulator